MADNVVNKAKKNTEEDKKIISEYIDNNWHMLTMAPEIAVKLFTNQGILDVFSLKEKFDVEKKEDIENKIINVLENWHPYKPISDLVNNIYENAKQEYLNNKEKEKNQIKAEINQVQKDFDIHKKNMCRLWIDNIEHIEWVIDAIVMQPELIKKMLGNVLYERIKDKLSTKKMFYNDISDEQIIQTPDFQEYFWIMVNHKILLMKINFEADKADLLDEYEDKLRKKIEDKKHDIAVMEKMLEGLKRTDPRFTFVSDLNRNSQDIIKNFLKKYKFGDADYSIDKVIEMKNKIKNRMNQEIKDFNRKNDINNTEIKEVKVDENQIKKNLFPTALSDFRKTLDKWNNSVYGENDVRKMKNIAKRFENKLDKQTDPEINMENIKEDKSLSYGRLKINKADQKIWMNRENLSKIMDYKEALKWLVTSDNIRAIIFNRMIEYIMMRQINYWLNKNIKIDGRFHIIKSNIMDDVFAWTDYILTFKHEWKNYVWFVDLMIWNSGEAEDESVKTVTEDRIKAKQEKASEPKIIYNYWINQRLRDNEIGIDWKEIYKLPKARRIVEVFHPNLAYNIIKESIKNLEGNSESHEIDKELLKEFDNRINKAKKGIEIPIFELEENSVILS